MPNKQSQDKNQQNSTSVDSTFQPDYRNAVGTLMLENSENSAKIKRWSILIIIFQVLGIFLMAAALMSLMNALNTQKNIREIREDPLGEVKITTDKIAASTVTFDQLDQALKDKITNITNNVNQINQSINNQEDSQEEQTTNTGTGGISRINVGNGLNGGTIVSTGGISINAPTCANNERLTWNGTAFTCSAVTAGISSASGPLVLNLSSGNLSCPTCLTNIGTLLDIVADSGANNSLNVGDALSLLGGVGIETSNSLGNITTISLSSTGVTPGTYGSGSATPVFTVDGQGRISSVNNTAISLNANQISSGILPVDRGGTGVNGSTASNGQLLIGNGSGFTLAGLSSSGAINVTNASGSIIIDCPTCVTTSGNGNIVQGTGLSISGTTTGRLIGAGNVTFGLASNVPTSVVNDTNVTGSIAANALTLGWSGQLSTARGGTGVNGSAASNGQLLIGNGSGYSLATLTQSGPISVSNGAGSITIDCPTCVTTSGNGNVTSSGGDITLTGTTTGRLIGAGNVNFDLSATGVAAATYGSASQVPVFTVDSKGRITTASNVTIGGLTTANLSGTAGITNAQLQNSGITFNAGNGLSGGGSVSLGGSTAIAVNAPTCLSTQRLSWNGSAFVCSTVAGTGNEAANTFFAGPTAGGPAIPSFRTIVPADLGSGTANNQSFLRGDQTWFQLLDGGGKIDSSLLPSSTLQFKGTWNATTNIPALSNSGGGGSNGDFYVVDTAGPTVLDGNGPWTVGDWVINNGSAWERVASTSAVSSVNSQTGAVVLDTDDITEGAGNLYYTDARTRGALSINGSGPLTFNSGTGEFDCPTCVTTSGNGNIVAGSGLSISGTLTGRLIGSGNVTFGLGTNVPTSVVNDTNVTGSIASNALTLGWSGQLSTARGGTGVDGSSASNGQLLIGNGSGYSLATLTQAGPISVSNGAGSITIDCPTCVTTTDSYGDLTSTGGDVSLSGTATGRLFGAGNMNLDLSATGVTAATYGSASQVPVFTVDAKGRLTSAGSTSIAIAASQITSGTLSVNRGGTGLDGSSASNGQLLIGNGTGYSLANITASGPLGVTNGAGTINLTCATCVTTSGNGNIVAGSGLSISGTLTGRLIGSGNVTFGLGTSVPTSVVNDTNITGSIASNALTLGWSGQLSAARGGTGVDGSSATNGQLLIGNGSGYSLATLTQAGPIGITNSAGGITIDCATCLTTGTTLYSAAADSGVTQSVTQGQTITFVGGTGLSSVASAGRIITVNLDNTAVSAGSYGSASSIGTFTVDAQGRLTAAANTAISIAASQISSGILSTSRGGTGVDGSSATNGQLLIGNGSGYTLANLSGGSGISITNASGAITIANTGAAATCSVSSNYACNNGNTLAGALTIGTNDTNGLNFETNNTTRFGIDGAAATLTGNGATTLTSSSTMTLNSATASALNIDSGTTGAINIGTGANAKAITIGNTTGATGVTINSGSGNINFQPGGTGTTANVQIGSGGAGSTTPDMLLLDVKSNGGDPSGTNGAMYYNASSGKFRCYENGAWKDCIGGGASINLGHAASYDTNEALQNVAASEVTLGTVSVTPNTATGDVYVTGQADVYSSNNTDQTFVLTLETGATCTGTTVATRSFVITSNASTTVDRGSLIVSGIASNPGASAQSYSLCASTATGDTDVLNWRIEALVTDTNSSSGSSGNASADSVSDTSVTSPTPGTNPTFGTEVEILNPTNPTITPDTASQRIYVTGGVQFTNGSDEDTDTTIRVRIRRGSGSCAGTQVGPDITATVTDPFGSIWLPFSVIDSPATTSAQAYTVCAATRDGNGATGSNATTPTVMMSLQEVAATGADLAETYYTFDDAEAGDVVSIDSSLKAGVRKSNQAYDATALGVISTKPGFILEDPADRSANARPVELALSGRVPVKVSDENGPVKVGDPLTSSSTPGKAMKATQPGWVIGVTLEDQKASDGSVLAFVNRSWYQGDGSKKPGNDQGLQLGGDVAGLTSTKIESVQNGLISNNPELMAEAVSLLKGIRDTNGQYESRIAALEASINGRSIAQAAFNGGIVSGDTEFQGNVVFNAITSFKGKSVFLGDAEFNGDVSFKKIITQAKDSAGTATVAAGTNSIRVNFSPGSYSKAPVVNLTPKGEAALDTLKYAVSDVSTSGFTILVNPIQDDAVEFNWIATQTQ